jgi:hypothetical protein
MGIVLSAGDVLIRHEGHLTDLREAIKETRLVIERTRKVCAESVELRLSASEVRSQSKKLCNSSRDGREGHSKRK